MLRTQPESTQAFTPSKPDAQCQTESSGPAALGLALAQGTRARLKKGGYALV